MIVEVGCHYSRMRNGFCVKANWVNLGDFINGWFNWSRYSRRKLVNFKVAQSHSYEFKGHPHNPKVYQVLSFGYLPSVIDWRWLKVLMDAPVFQKKLEVKSQLYFDLNLLADLDVDFRDVYVHGAHLVSLLYFDPEGAITLLKRGISTQEILDLQGQSRILADQWENQWRFRSF